MGLARPARARASGRINASCACLPGKTRGCFAAAFFFMTPLALRSLALCSFTGCFHRRAFFVQGFQKPSRLLALVIGSGFTAFALRSLRGGRPIFLACLRGRKVFIKQSRLDEQAGSLAFTPGFFCRRAGGRKALKIRSEFKGSEMSVPQSSLGHNAMERGADQVLPAPCPAHFHKWSAGQLRGACGRFIWE